MEIATKVANKQAKLVYSDNHLSIITSEIDVDGEVINLKETKVKLFHSSISLSDLRRSDIEFIKYILKNISTRKYPTVPMIELEYKLTSDPDNALTQAILEWCAKDKCLCALFFSIGCPEFWNAVIEPEIGIYRHNIAGILEKKCIKTTLTGLRKYLSADDVSEIGTELVVAEQPIIEEEE